MTHKNREFDRNDILILCKIVDNFGDAGVVYRLALSLKEKTKNLKLRIVTDNVEVFSKMAEEISPAKERQTVFGFEIFNSKNEELCFTEFSTKKPSVILECFQCGRPDWLEKILFDEENSDFYQIINIDYLTAEKYAEEFHLLKSGTRSIFVKKINFMPGFTKKTGGLILNDDFMNSLKEAKHAINGQKNNDEFKITVFSYERDFTGIFNVLSKIQNEKRKISPDFSIKILAASGKSLPYAEDAWKKTGKALEFISLPFLNQREWDKILCGADFNFVRGEDSLSRAALGGAPFVWHAYVQDENYHLVKVNALLDELLPFIPQNFRKTLSALWEFYNTPSREIPENLIYELFSALILNNDRQLKNSFKTFSENLITNGNLTEKLLDFISTLAPGHTTR